MRRYKIAVVRRNDKFTVEFKRGVLSPWRPLLSFSHFELHGLPKKGRKPAVYDTYEKALEVATKYKKHFAPDFERWEV